MTYTFGQFRLEVERNRLLHDGEPVQLRRKSYEILLLLVEHPGEIITKDQIISTVWPDQMVEENNLTQQIYKLRRLLGDTPKDQNYILTVPGKGYLFNKPVTKEYHHASSIDTESLPETSITAEDGAAPSAVKPSQIRRRIILLVAILLGILGLLAVARLVINQYSPGSINGIQPRVTPFATLQGIESYPKFSPDGKFLAFTSEGEDEYNLDIYIKMVNQGETIRVTSHPDDDEQAVWSPDGRRLAFLRKSRRIGEPYKLITVSPLGGPEQEIAQVLGGLDWSPDGQNFAVSSNEGNGTSTGIYLVSVDGQKRRLVSNPSTPEIVYDTYPVFSTDGKRIAFVRWSAEQVGELNVINLETGTVRQITNDRKSITALRWSPDSRDLLFVSNRNGNQRLWRIPVNGGVATMINGVPGEIEHFDLLRDGKMLAYTQMLNDTTIRVEPLGDRQSTTNSNLPCTINSSRTDDTPAFSPDGSRLAFISNRSGWQEIWLASHDCSHTTQLTDFKEVGLGSQSWSPTGQEIAFDRYHNGQSQIFVISADGSQLRQITSDPAGAFMPSWSADGKWIYYSSFKFGISQIWKAPAAGDGTTAPIRITENQGRNAVESSDGRYLYYTRFGRLFRKDLQTGTESPIQELENFTIGRYWTLAANQIFFVIQEFGNHPVIHQFDIKTGSVRKSREIDGYLSRFTPGLAITSDLKLIAYSYISYRLGDIMLIEGWN